jgi:hypothetical protein
VKLFSLSFQSVLHFFYLTYTLFIRKRLLRGHSQKAVLFTDSPFGRRMGFRDLISLPRGNVPSSELYILFVSGRRGAEYVRSIGLRGNFYLLYPHVFRKELEKCGGSVQFEFPLMVCGPEVRKMTFQPWHFFAAIALFWIYKVSMGSFYPADDLLRHVVSYRWGYDYSIPFIETVFHPTFDYYIGFDFLAGLLHRYIGNYSIPFFQLLTFGLTFFGLARILRYTNPSVELLAFAVLVRLAFGRFVSGRPSTLCSGVMLFLLAYDDRLSGPLKTIVGAVFSVFYYFFFLYLIPLVVMDRKYIVSLLTGVAFWVLYSGGHYFCEMYQVISSLKNQNMAVLENMSLIGFFAFNWLFAIPFVLHFKKDIRTSIILVFFLLSNQIRYIETIVPLMLSFFRFTRIKIHMAAAWGISVFLVFPILGQGYPIFNEIPGHIPPGARVLTEDMKTMYLVLNQNPTIKIAPCYAYGWTEKQIQESIKEILRGNLDCKSNTRLKFDYLIETSLKGEIPPCLELVFLEKGWRLWRFTPVQ